MIKAIFPELIGFDEFGQTNPYNLKLTSINN